MSKIDDGGPVVQVKSTTEYEDHVYFEMLQSISLRDHAIIEFTKAILSTSRGGVITLFSGCGGIDSGITAQEIIKIAALYANEMITEKRRNEILIWKKMLLNFLQGKATLQ